MSKQRDVTLTMYRFKVYKAIFCFLLLFNPATGKECQTVSLYDAASRCPETQICDEATKSCQCPEGFVMYNESFCVDTTRKSRDSTPNSSSLVASHNSGSIVAGILIPLFLILFVIYAIYVSRKYKLVSWFRRKLHQRNSNYDEFMIGQDIEDDDPPLH